MRFKSLRKIFARKAALPKASEVPSAPPLSLEDVVMFSSRPLGSQKITEGAHEAEWKSSFIRALRVGPYRGASTRFKLTIHTAKATVKDGRISYGASDIDGLPHQRQLSFIEAVDFIRNWEAQKLSYSGTFVDSRDLNQPHIHDVAPLLEAYKTKAKARFQLVRS